MINPYITADDARRLDHVDSARSMRLDLRGGNGANHREAVQTMLGLLALYEEQDARIKELLEANNREVERRRRAEEALPSAPLGGG